MTETTDHTPKPIRFHFDGPRLAHANIYLGEGPDEVELIEHLTNLGLRLTADMSIDLGANQRVATLNMSFYMYDGFEITGLDETALRVNGIEDLSTEALKERRLLEAEIAAERNEVGS